MLMIDEIIKDLKSAGVPVDVYKNKIAETPVKRGSKSKKRKKKIDI